jgi:tripartite-type tricarboxylate transporter receptor subunit TctC
MQVGFTSRTWVRSIALAATAACATGIATGARAASADDYPNKPLRLITGFLPGGVSDAIARIVGTQLGFRLNERVVIDGRPGAGGLLSMELAAKATPDGYTLFLAQPIVSLAVVTKRVNYDAVKAFAPISLVGSSQTLVAVNPQLPITTVKDLIDAARAKPGSYNYGSSGHGGPNHLAAELFQYMTGTKLVHVPYKGAGAAIPATISGEVPLTFTPFLAGLPHARAGRLRPLGVSSPKRVRAAPEIPAIAELVPGFEAVSWFGFVVPAATPQRIVTRLNTELVKVMEMPEVRDQLSNQGVEPDFSTPARFLSVMQTDVERWTKIVRETGIKID